MTTEFATLLRILSSASAGEPFPALPEGLDWPLLEKLAREQSAPGLWGYALYHAKAVIPEPVLVRGKQQYFFLVAREAYRRAGILRLLADLDGMGIRAAVLKGFAVGESYAVPECRISGDVDLLVDPKDEARTIALLTGQGFTVQRRCVDAHHDIAVHPSLGLVELHVRLYEEMFGQHWFEGAFLAPARPHVRMETPKGVFWTLAPDDHMLFLL
ncbi:MAG: nucleotidyltransferase family protein, partial [Clostridiales bacterium]|nr:nucleotidyltransferase family protein [Clostridiales bacterium]